MKTGPDARLRPLFLALLLGAMARIAYLALTELPRFDPWRHLKLVENIRAGRGFTLFDGQPYLWHHPAWYYLSAALPARIGGQWLAGALSLLAVGLVWRWVRATHPASPWAANAAALMTALFGPLVSFTCHLGPESFALALVFAALVLVSARPGLPAAVAAGALFGLAAAVRLNFAVNLFLFLPFLATRRRALAWSAGAAVPLAAAWWRNHHVIASYPWVFTWDGLATRSADFNALSTLIIQMHPAVREGLRRLHAHLVPVPLWFRGPDGISWGPLLFLLLAAGALVASRRRELALTGFTAAGAFLFLDRSLSANFFRVWLAVFPALIAAVAIAADRIRTHGDGRSRVPALVAGGLVALVLACGVGELLPQAMYPIEAVTPPPGLLAEDAYLVNSGFYHPEAPAWRYPDKRFVGLPLDPAEVDDFLRAFPGTARSSGMMAACRTTWPAIWWRPGVRRRAQSRQRRRPGVRGADAAAGGVVPVSAPISTPVTVNQPRVPAAGAVFPAVVFFGALALRGISLALFLRTPYALYPVLDARRFYEWALEILAGTPAPGPFLYEPLYAYLQVAIYALTGIDFHHLLVFQAVAGSLGALLAYFILLEHLPPRWSLAGALAYAAYPVVLLADTLPIKESLATVLLLAALLLLQRHLRSGRTPAAFSRGAVLRPGAARAGESARAGAPVRALPAGDRRRCGRRRAPDGGAAAGVALAVLPVTARNCLVGGDCVLVAASGGSNLFMAFNERSRGDSFVQPAFARSGPARLTEDSIAAAGRIAGRPVTPSEASRFWSREALRYVLGHPARSAGLLAQRLWVSLGNDEISGNYPHEFFSRVNPLVGFNPLGFGLVLAFGVVGWWCARGDRRTLLFPAVFLGPGSPSSPSGPWIGSACRWSCR